MASIIEKKTSGSISAVIDTGEILAFELSQQAINEVFSICATISDDTDAVDLNRNSRLVVFVGKISDFPVLTGFDSYDVSFLKAKSIDVLLDVNFKKDEPFIYNVKLQSDNSRGLSVVLLPSHRVGAGMGVAIPTLARLTVIGASRSNNSKTFDVVLDNKFDR